MAREQGRTKAEHARGGPRRPTRNQPAAAPRISLPSGGGALRGMGDRFQANGFTGVASFTIPLPTSPSRSLTPALAIAYASTGGHDVFGLGMSLSLSSISRRSSHGVPHYNDGDVFLLDGRPLVPD